MRAFAVVSPNVEFEITVSEQGMYGNGRAEVTQSWSTDLCYY